MILEIKTKPLYVCLVFPLVWICFFCAYNYSYANFWADFEQIYKPYNASDNTGRPKYILYWTDFFFDKVWNFGEGQQVFVDHGCQETNCYITANRTLIPVEEFDALLFHGATYCSRSDQPLVRSPHQRYVFASMESPPHMLCPKRSYQNFNNFYNLTLTYRLDSDISWPYATIVDLTSNLVVAPAPFPRWAHAENKISAISLQIAKTKFAKSKKMVAWIVSNCRTPSNREDVVRELRELRQHVDIDVFGRCGPLTCGSRENQASSECFQMVNDNYKFYLSLENSLCSDYVTEKLYRPLSINVIPIVYGGCKYESMAPPNSYIDINAFSTLKSLAEYLIYLSDNEEEYAKYFTWKEHYRISEMTPFCDLCKMLNDPESSGKIIQYNDLLRWWYGDNDEQCSSNVRAFA